MNIIKDLFIFIRHAFSSRELLLTLIKNDFRKQYLGSYFGIFWAFFQPLAFMLIIWFVFEKGFQVGKANNGAPYFLWLACGMIPWLFISNALISGTGAIVNNAFMVRKVAFRVSILPLVEIGSALIVHLVLLAFLMSVSVYYGYKPTLYWLQLPFYLACSIALLLGLTWLTSAISVFIKDVSSFIMVFTQLGFWATPIFWSLEVLPERVQKIFQVNPVYYIVNGYRDAFVTNVWFWERQDLTLHYVGLMLVCMATGALVFKRLRPHFGDVL
ncbi:ABC transporter permease [Aquipseudomonas alcaligenes]|uniref:ABC transporter permease n=1 Tax=Aquipseudomonas alcaligenes TaxID=43263 RepID=UPI003659EAF6